MFKERLKESVRNILKEMGIQEEIDFKIEIPPEGFGDLSTNAAFLLSKPLGKNPRELAFSIADKLRGEPEYENVEIAGPGFINVNFSRGYFADVLEEFAAKPEFWKLEGERKIQFEFASANPTGPFTVGHGRQAVFGDVLCRVFSARGYALEREMYINDAGRQINLLGRSLWVRYNQLIGEDIDLPEDGYQGEYLVEMAETLRGERGEKFKLLWNEEVERFFKEYALKAMLADIHGTLRRLGVVFDSVFFESSTVKDGTVERVLKHLETEGYVYRSEGANWLRVSSLVEDDDKVLVRTNGTYTYFMTDIAYHWNKYKRGFEKVYDIWGADHMGHIPRMKAAMKALGIPDGFLNIIIHQYVNLKREGEVIKMSTRKGEFTTLDELVDSVGVDAARYFFAMFDPDTHMLFDIDLARKQSSDNPVFYVQYAHARISSIFKTALEKGVTVNNSDFQALETDEEKKLVKLVSIFPEILDSILLDYKTNKLTSYLEDLARAFHAYYNKYTVVDTENAKLSGTRLALCGVVRDTIKSGLELLGVSAPESM